MTVKNWWVIFFVLVTSACNQIPDSAKSAYEELRKMEAKTNVGITYVNYLQALGEVKYAVDKYLKDERAKDNLDLFNCIENAMQDYEYAASAWKLMFDLKRQKPNEGTLHFPKNSQLGKLIEMHLIITERENCSAKHKNYESTNYVLQEEILSWLWMYASCELKRAKEIIDGGK